MKYDTIIFDLDGTLVNTLEDLTESVNSVMAREGYPLKTLDQVRDAIGEGYRVLLERCLPQDTEDLVIDRCTNLFTKHYIGNMINKTMPYKDIPDMLERLKNSGFKIGVVSNKMDQATKDICNYFFGSLIDAAVGDNAERNKKPSPDNVYEVLSQLDSDKEKAIYIGDSCVDVQTAKNAGLVCIGVTWGYRSKEVLIKEGAYTTIDEPFEILDIVLK